MNTPAGIAVSGSNLWVASEYILGFIQEWTTAGSETQTFTSYNSISYDIPRDMAAGPDGYLYVADGSHVAVELSSAGTYVTTFGTTELGSDDTDAVVVGANRAYLLDDSAPKVLAYTISGTGAAKTFSASATFGGAVLGTIPKGIALDGTGNVYVADSANGRIVEFNSAGVTQAAVTLVSSGVPAGIAVDGAGYLYATDSHNNEVQMFNASGAAVTQFGSAVLSSASGIDMGIALDASGNLFVSSSAANQVVEFKRN
jgi:tripartite motif-containing protein 71